ncbi:hypothetical protein [Phyllobacterium sp. K27]
MSSRKLDETRPAKTAAQRKRDQRTRERAGEDIFKLKLPRYLVVDGLVEMGKLEEWNDNDRQEAERALERLILSLLPTVTRDQFTESDLLNSDHETNRDSADAGKGPKTR